MARNERDAIDAAEWIRLNPGFACPGDVDLDVIWGPLTPNTLRRHDGEKDRAAEGRFMAKLNEALQYIDGDGIYATVAFSPEGSYGVKPKEDQPSGKNGELVVPAGWYHNDQMIDVWRCLALYLRLALLPDYRRMYGVTESFADTMEEAMVDGLALFLQMAYRAKSEERRAYVALRSVLTSLSRGGTGEFCYEVEAHGWMNAGFMYTDELDRDYFLDESHFSKWLTHSPQHPRMNLVGMFNGFERALRGTKQNREMFAGLGMEVSEEARRLLLRIPAPWEFTAVLVAEAIDRTIDRKDNAQMTHDTIALMAYVLKGKDGREKIRRLLAPEGPHDLAESATGPLNPAIGGTQERLVVAS